MTIHPDKFDKNVSGVIQSLRILIADGKPSLRAERQKLLDEFLEVNDEFEATDPEGKSKEQIRQDLKKMPELKVRYEAVIGKIRDHSSRIKEEIPHPPAVMTTRRTEPIKPNHFTSIFSKEVSMLKEFETADGRKISYTPKRLGLRGMRNLLECIEGLKDVSKKSEIFELVENGLKLCIADYDPETMDVTLESAMKIMTDSLTFNTSNQSTEPEAKQETE